MSTQIGANNSSLCPPPLYSPLTTTTGRNTLPGRAGNGGNIATEAINPSWQQWFSNLYAKVGTGGAANPYVVYVSQQTGADVGAQINNAYAALPSGGGMIILDVGGSFTTPIVFGTANKVAMLMGYGDATGITYTASTGTAITFNNGNQFDFASGLQNITITGPGHSTSTIGLVLGGSNGAIGTDTRNCVIQSFGINVADTSESWLTRFSQCMIRDGGKNVNFGGTPTAAGENILFDHCCFADAPTPHTDSVWIQSAGNEVKFIACSFDQAQLRIGNGSTNSVVASCTACHFENPNYALPGAVDYVFFVQDNHPANILQVTNCFLEQDRPTGGNYPTYMVINGGAIQIFGFGCFSPVAVNSLCQLNNNVNISLFIFNDLGGNVVSIFVNGGSWTGFVTSFPGVGPGVTSGFNNILGANENSDAGRYGYGHRNVRQQS